MQLVAETFPYRHRLTGKVQEITEDAASVFPDVLERVDPEKLDLIETPGPEDTLTAAEHEEHKRTRKSSTKDKE